MKVKDESESEAAARSLTAAVGNFVEASRGFADACAELAEMAERLRRIANRRIAVRDIANRREAA